MLLATRFEGRPALYTCFPLGRVEQRYLTGFGSGSDHALGFIESQGLNTPPHLSTPETLDLVVSAIDVASRDMHTGGLDYVVVTPGGINEHGKTVNEAVKAARDQALSRVRNYYKIVL